MRLTKAKAKAVAQTEISGPEMAVLEPGLYRARLVDVQPKQGPKGPYWEWVFQLDEPGVPARKLWENTSLSEGAEWKIKQVYAAFGADPSLDTDELLGEHVMLELTVITRQAGKRKGQEDNEIQSIQPIAEEDDEPADGEDDEDDEEDEGVVDVEDDGPGDGDVEEDDDEEDVPPPKSKKTALPPSSKPTPKADSGFDARMAVGTALRRKSASATTAASRGTPSERVRRARRGDSDEVPF